ncbi:Hypothetical protein NTJ_10070 [Nesidiocoris tenuis]|uniref:Uncharacterized protein n=1 Tax=Nesidiocoris tenuis TaxID=355587 RepID=A0ABN7AYJ0_9HEMI|nr:Hypothetical protein NTJ_10070 [Nesidiocoris tenuis]
MLNALFIQLTTSSRTAPGSTNLPQSSPDRSSSGPSRFGRGMSADVGGNVGRGVGGLSQVMSHHSIRGSSMSAVPTSEGIASVRMEMLQIKVMYHSQLF